MWVLILIYSLGIDSGVALEKITFQTQSLCEKARQQISLPEQGSNWNSQFTTICVKTNVDQ
jgi:hypothetical protein